MPGQFKCQYANCLRTYKRKEHLVRHEKSHGQLRPFRCSQCGADFHRNDLLKRHVRLSSKCKAVPNEERQPPFSKAAANLEPEPDPTSLQPVLTIDSLATAASRLRNEIYERLGPSLAAIARREELERVYFHHFHPHWPLLDRDMFMNSQQLPELVAAVLIAGLWMIPTSAARLEASSQHDILMQEVTKRLLKEQPECTTLSMECLSHFQALLIPLIIFTYKPLNEHFPNAVMCIRHLHGFLRHTGCYQQRRIDEFCSDPAIRQQYQRLALLHYKLFMHINSLVRSQFSRFEQFEYFKPSILQVRVPVVGTNHSRSALDNGLVSDLLNRSYIDKFSQATIASLTAWDFSLGMIFACIITQNKDEDGKSLLRRMEPNLFLYLAGWEVDPGDSPTPSMGEIITLTKRKS
ncbi:hypothetical protein F5Y06DRAFT_257289 [Hypoxylon sp. FL0890]|nr:hypothetical protein F5Y06DRAFT_257289 [Hypoxylon sp. FL0890]